MVMSGWVRADLYLADLTVDEAAEIKGQLPLEIGAPEIVVRSMVHAHQSQTEFADLVNRVTLRIAIEGFPAFTAAWITALVNWDASGRQGPPPFAPIDEGGLR